MKQKSIDDILKSLEGEDKVFVVGCADCATACQVGGEQQVEEMKSKLEEAGKTVTGMCIMDTACLKGEVRKQTKANKDAFDAADSVLCLTCGTGCQTIGDNTGKPSHIGADSMFVGEVQHLGSYTEKCSTCGACVLEETEGICPVTRCTKSLLNGPCGGSQDGKCEVDPEKDCAWALIYERLRERGKLDKMKPYKQPKDQSKRTAPRSYKWPKPERKKEQATS